jgi:hypothetical protein
MPFHSLQERIEGPRADLVAMVTQFAHHPLPVNGTLGGMVKYMDLPKAEEDLASHGVHFCGHITNIVDDYRSQVQLDLLASRSRSFWLKAAHAAPASNISATSRDILHYL